MIAAATSTSWKSHLFLRLLVVTLLLGGGWAGRAGAEELLLGRIDFPTSGNADAQQEFIQGVLALHSFWYPEARDRFREAQSLDPGFGMAYWGEAMTYDDPLGTAPAHGSEDGEQLGAGVVARSSELDLQGRLRWSERERGYADAVRRRFEQEVPLSVRRENYFTAMRDLAERYPDDHEATAFAALALMALPGFDTEQANHVVAVAGRLEDIYEKNREHPGVLHYLIHVYDTETFARIGLRQARRYAAIAPASPHALHMPSHIFRHLGMWEEVAASNAAAYEVSVEWQERTQRPLHMRDFHSLDWLLGAYLALGRYDDARDVMDEVDAVEAEIRRKGEELGDVPMIAEQMREYYERSIPPTGQDVGREE